MKIVRKILLQLREGLRKSNHAKKANEDNDKDQDKFPLDLRAHAGLLALLLFELESSDGIARYLDFHLFGDAQLDGVVFEANNSAIDAAIRNNLIAILQISEHLRDLFLPALRGHDQKEVHQDKNCPHRNDKGQAARLRCLRPKEIG